MRHSIPDFRGRVLIRGKVSPEYPEGFGMELTPENGAPYDVDELVRKYRHELVVLGAEIGPVLFNGGTFSPRKGSGWEALESDSEKLFSLHKSIPWHIDCEPILLGPLSGSEPRQVPLYLAPADSVSDVLKAQVTQWRDALWPVVRHRAAADPVQRRVLHCLKGMSQRPLAPNTFQELIQPQFVGSEFFLEYVAPLIRSSIQDVLTKVPHFAYRGTCDLGNQILWMPDSYYRGGETMAAKGAAHARLGAEPDAPKGDNWWRRRPDMSSYMGGIS